MSNVDSESNKPEWSGRRCCWRHIKILLTPMNFSSLLTPHQNIAESIPIVLFAEQLSYLCMRGNYNIISNQFSTLTNYYWRQSKIYTHSSSQIIGTDNYYNVFGNCLLNTLCRQHLKLTTIGWNSGTWPINGEHTTHIKVCNWITKKYFNRLKLLNRIIGT